MVEVNEKLLTLTKDPDKYESITSKLVALHLDVLKDLKAAQRCLISQIKFFETLNDSQRIRTAHCELIRIVQTQKIQELEKEDDQLLKLSLTQVVVNEP